mmetsp:Transcript_102750/g.209334  ORF Transcript_102750/g.209334 Transcript_102750/m.209334 type:complete len:94 (+) Transcript_102750:737-1018(+)
MCRSLMCTIETPCDTRAIVQCTSRSALTLLCSCDYLYEQTGKAKSQSVRYGRMLKQMFYSSLTRHPQMICATKDIISAKWIPPNQVASNVHLF